MPRRGESIHKRKDKRWEGGYMNCYDSSGKAKQILSEYRKNLL